MAEPKKISTRIINKHATAAVWNNTNFTPLQGEIVVYDPGYDSTDEKTYSYERMKIGDGSHTIQELPFITENLNLELTAEDNNSLLMWDNNNSTLVSSPLEKGTGNNSLVINEGVASGNTSIAGGTTDKEMIEELVGSTVAAITNLNPSEARGALSIALGADNKSNTSGSVTLGYKNIGGGKGYYFDGFDGKTITLSTTRRTSTLVAPSYPSSVDWAIGDRLLMVNDDRYWLTITAVDGNKITVEEDIGSVNYSATLTIFTYSKPNDRTIINIDKPENGVVDIGWGAIGIGSLNTVIGSNAYTVGYKNEVAGDFGTAFGQENLVGYSAFATGIGNEAKGKAAFAEGNGNIASGENAHVEGTNNTASGTNAHAEGNDTEATETNAHAEGNHTTASGKHSHAEGANTKALSSISHAEGWGSIANNVAAHAEGYETYADGENTHAEGYYTRALGLNSHAEGTSSNKCNDIVSTDDDNDTIISKWTSTKFALAKGEGSHTEGRNGLALGNFVHVEGYNNAALKDRSHAEGSGTVADGWYAHSEGQETEASGEASHAEGIRNTANASGAHAEGNTTTASGKYSHTEGYSTKATNSSAHAEGDSTTASGSAAHAEGRGTQATGQQAHAEGKNTTASNTNAHAEGQNTTASGMHSHAEGADSIASGNVAHVEGYGNIAKGACSHVGGYTSKSTHEGAFVHGYNLSTSRNYQIVLGDDNEDNADALLILGRGDHTKGNALEVLEDSIKIGGIKYRTEQEEDGWYNINYTGKVEFGDSGHFIYSNVGSAHYSSGEVAYEHDYLKLQRSSGSFISLEEGRNNDVGKYNRCVIKSPEIILQGDSEITRNLHVLQTVFSDSIHTGNINLYYDANNYVTLTAEKLAKIIKFIDSIEEVIE